MYSRRILTVIAFAILAAMACAGEQNYNSFKQSGGGGGWASHSGGGGGG